MFKGRKLLIATKHRKENVIAPLLTENLGVECLISEKFDTDTLGTFTGEVLRKDSPLHTARNKCLKAMELYHCDLGIASEGSFGPHPALFFIPADEEILIFIDKLHGLEIVARVISTETNFAAQKIETEEKLVEFAEKAQFPSHALILRNDSPEGREIIKGIKDPGFLKASFHRLREKEGQIYAETDMRAMFNPSRMEVIRDATQQLLEKINSCCPACHTPGFDISEARTGLPCSCCNAPTRSTLSYLYQCCKCTFQKEIQFPLGKMVEYPGYCDLCNP